MYALDPPSHVIPDLKKVEFMVDGLRTFFALDLRQQQLVREKVKVATDRENLLGDRVAALRVLRGVLLSAARAGGEGSHDGVD